MAAEVATGAGVDLCASVRATREEAMRCFSQEQVNEVSEAGASEAATVQAQGRAATASAPTAATAWNTKPHSRATR